MPYYENYQIFVPVSPSNYLTINRANLLLRELPLVPGTEGNPGLCWQGDERAGLWNVTEGETGFSSFGRTCFSVTKGAFRVWDRFGRTITFEAPSIDSNKTVTLPATSGTLALREDTYLSRVNDEIDSLVTGTVVKLNPSNFNGVVRAQGDIVDNFALGVVRFTVAATEIATILTTGVVFLTDWTDVTGTALLIPGKRYYADDINPGMITDGGAQLQLIGIAISETELLLRLG